jgi:DNA-binding PadR family transcriptional regulator
LVETYLQESREGGARKYYKLNQKGKQAVKKESKEWERLIKKYQQFLQNIANLY